MREGRGSDSKQRLSKAGEAFTGASTGSHQTQSGTLTPAGHPHRPLVLGADGGGAGGGENARLKETASSDLTLTASAPANRDPTPPSIGRCVTTHLPSQVAPKMVESGACGPYLPKLAVERAEHGREGAA